MQNAGSDPIDPGAEARQQARAEARQQARDGWDVASTTATAMRGAVSVMGEVLRIAAESTAGDGLDYLRNYLLGLHFDVTDDELVHYERWVKRGRP